MSKVRHALSTPFGAAVIGGLVVGILGLVAIATGLVKSSDSNNAVASLAPVPLPHPAAQTTDGNTGLTVNQIYRQDSPGVAFIQAQQAPQQSSLLNPFGGGGGGGGTATGSGFVIDTQGHVLTNAHVVDGATKIQVTLGNADTSQPVSAQVVGKDPSTDIALLKVDAPADQLHPVPLGSSAKAQVGDAVVAIGNPFGLDRTVTSGIVSALQRQIKAPNGFTIDNVIQTDAAINPGNSGGPLLDANGQVIGITSQIESPNGGGNVGVGFAVPINTARSDVQQLLANGSVQHAYLGISGGTITPDIAKALNLPVEEGVLVAEAVKGGPAAEAGIEGGDTKATIEGSSVTLGGDIITELDGKKISSMEELVNVVNGKKTGEEIKVTLLRGGNQKTVTVKLGNRPASVK